MGVVSDAIDAIEQFFKDLVADGIKWSLDTTSSMLIDTFQDSAEEGGLVSTFLTSHPAKFTGSPTGSGTTVWSTIEGLCNNVVVPIGGFILAIILINDLIQMVIRGNNFKDFDDSIFIKWIIKSVCGVLLVSNVFYIASGLFAFGTDACAGAVAQIFGTTSSLATVSIDSSALASTYSLGQLFIVLIISIVVLIASMILMVAIIITLASRIIEVFMYLSIAPVPMATMMDSGEWSSIGKNWVKQLLALSFQGFFVILALAIFSTLFTNAISSLNDGGTGIIMQMAMLLGYVVAIIFTVLRTGAISKSVFNAH